jgi:hypothetical protein
VIYLEVLKECLGKKLPIFLRESRAIIKFQNCKYVIKDSLPLPSRHVPPYPTRWEKFPAEEFKYLFERLKENSYPHDIRTLIKKLNSLKFYLQILRNHRAAVWEVWNEMPG